MSAMSALAFSPSADAAPGRAVLDVGRVRLMLPQSDIDRIVPAADVTESPADDGWEAGWLVRDDGVQWPVYSLGESLELQALPSAARGMCAFVVSGNLVHGILCARVELFDSADGVGIEAVPGCMGSLRSLATGLTRMGGEIILATDAVVLSGYLLSLQESMDG